MSRIFWAGECLLCGCTHCDEGGGLLVKRKGDPDCKSFVLFFCLDCLDDRLEEVNEKEKEIIEQENLVRFW